MIHNKVGVTIISSKKILLIMTILVILVLIGCSKENDEDTDLEIQESTSSKDNIATVEAKATIETVETIDIIETETSSANNEETYLIKYSEILDKYYTALYEKWTPQELSNASLNILCEYCYEGNNENGSPWYFITGADQANIR